MKAIFILMVWFLGPNGSAQTNYLVRVCDSETKKPLRDVIIKIDTAVMESNAGGFFQVKGDTSMILQVSLNGYESSLLKLPTEEKFVFYLKRIETASELELKKSFYKYIGENIKYPRDARRASIQGTSLVYFEVDTLGKIIDTDILNRVSAGCSEEVVRVLKHAPQVWHEVKRQTKFALPVIFKFDGEKFPKEKIDRQPPPGTIFLEEVVVVAHASTFIR